mgnify:FL=1
MLVGPKQLLVQATQRLRKLDLMKEGGEQRRKKVNPIAPWKHRKAKKLARTKELIEAERAFRVEREFSCEKSVGIETR